MKSDDVVNDFREAQNLHEEIKSGKLTVHSVPPAQGREDYLLARC